MPKSGRRAKANSTLQTRQENNYKTSLLDQLAEFEWFKENILPAMQADLKSGIKAEDLREKYHAMIQASLITTALMERDAGKRISAAKDLLDRVEGKAKERIEQTHKFDKLEEEQVDSIIKSKLAELSNEGPIKH